MFAGRLEDASFNQSPIFGDGDLFSADRPLAETLATVLRSGEAERRARFLCEGLAKIHALAA